MSRGASIFQLVMYSIGLILAVAEVGFCINAVVVLEGYFYEDYWMVLIGGIVHGGILVIYFIVLRNSVPVRTMTDLIMAGFFFVTSIIVGVFCAMIAFGPAAPLLFSFIVEAVVVGQSKVPGKWKMSLYNVCNGKNTNNQLVNQNVGAPSYPMLNQPFGGAPQYANVPNPGATHTYSYAAPYQPPQTPYQMPQTPYQMPQTPYQTPYGQSH
ncbi:hypothetical protein CspHIS471_0400470 [Cutaneotrichosporon sp. HIS471]|nr:hypothetical protein CspHIS471_0400470 [Cutaneotrichosporon sp. HIS471]